MMKAVNSKINAPFPSLVAVYRGSEKVDTKDRVINQLHKDSIATALAELDERILTLALMYAENYLKYGTDITEKIETAVKNAEMINMAERRGYCKCLEDMRK